MVVRRKMGIDVYKAALDRITPLYQQGHRVVVSFSTGKDSAAGLELCIEAARSAERLPVEAVMRDDEIMFPGTYEYAERVRARPEVDLHHLVARQPIVNVYSRTSPYWWAFDETMDPGDWVRSPPDYAEHIDDKRIEMMTTRERFPPPRGKELFSVLGLRTDESRARLYGLFSSRGAITRPNRLGVRLVRPIYDWSDADVWRAHKVNGWDHNRAYNVFLRMGINRQRLRIGPPTMNSYTGVDLLRCGAGAWPKWFDRVARRCPGVRAAVNFGQKAVKPTRHIGESWQACFHRTCIDEAPAAWIAERAAKVRDLYLKRHAGHSSKPFPETRPCSVCTGANPSWRKLALFLFGGDPSAQKFPGMLTPIEPEVFRSGDANANTWGAAV